MGYLSKEQRKLYFEMRKAMDARIADIVDDTIKINESISLVRVWKEGNYQIGDVRLYEGNPYKCVQAHDSTNNPTWNPTVTSLWMQYHGTSLETARAWIAPTGAHDTYKVGEYMVWTDGNIYQCIMDTNYSPAEYAQAWIMEV